VHISELAQQHVENPREIVQPGDDVRVKILEIDSERRRLSLSIKRVEDQILPRRDVQALEGDAGDAGDLDNVPELGLSEDVFATQPEAEVAPDAEAAAEPVEEAEPAEPVEAAEPVEEAEPAEPESQPDEEQA
jgi:small subunit ribosomal protein S1